MFKVRLGSVKAQVAHFHNPKLKVNIYLYSTFEMNIKKTMKSLYLWVSFILVFIEKLFG